jgi:ASC-1-like (ASCH) protein
MAKHHAQIAAENSEIFAALLDGRKPIETRAATPKWQAVKPGDDLEMSCSSDSAIFTVTRIEHYPTIEEMFAVIPVSQIIPGVDSVEAARDVYYSFPGYKEKLAEWGILAFWLQRHA